MSRNCRALVLAGLIVVMFLAPAGAEPLPSLVAEHPDHDFGEIFQGEQVTHVFTFFNKGAAPLVIDRIKSSCGCTAALLSSTNIPPGESGTIRATFDSSRFRGDVRKVIYLYSNAPGHEAARFSIAGTVRPLVEFDPPQLDFGEVEVGGHGEKKVVIVNAWNKPLRIENIRTSNVAFSAIAGVETLQPGGGADLTVAVRPLKETPHLRGYVLIRTDIDALGEIRLPVSGYIKR